MDQHPPYNEATEWMRLVGPNGPVTPAELEGVERRGVFISRWGEPDASLFIARPIPDGYGHPQGASRVETPEALAEREERDQRREEWNSAETLRRAWLTEFLQRKHTLTAVSSFIALTTFTRYIGDGYSLSYNDIPHELMGGGGGGNATTTALSTRWRCRSI